MNRTMNEPEREVVDETGKPYQSRNLRDAAGRGAVTNNTTPVKEDEQGEKKEDS